MSTNQYKIKNPYHIKNYEEVMLNNFAKGITGKPWKELSSMEKDVVHKAIMDDISKNAKQMKHEAKKLRGIKHACCK